MTLSLRHHQLCYRILKISRTIPVHEVRVDLRAGPRIEKRVDIQFADIGGADVPVGLRLERISRAGIVRSLGDQGGRGSDSERSCEASRQSQAQQGKRKQTLTHAHLENEGAECGGSAPFTRRLETSAGGTA